jgi:KaiC/GvpD/RAD55 family RecA-like ATPase
MPFGEVCYITAFSGHGKTTFLMSLTDTLFERTHDRIYYLGLESRRKTLRTMWACHRLGYHSGDILTGEHLQWPDCEAVREALKAELDTQYLGEKFAQVRFSPKAYVSASTLWEEAEAAKEMGANPVHRRSMSITSTARTTRAPTRRASKSIAPLGDCA